MKKKLFLYYLIHNEYKKSSGIVIYNVGHYCLSQQMFEMPTVLEPTKFCSLIYVMGHLSHVIFF